MKIEFINGHLSIDDNVVQVLIFRDGTTMSFPIEDSNKILVEDSSASANGDKNIVISGKNIIAPGSRIKCGGDFTLGDR